MHFRQFTAAFDALRGDEQIQLVEHLAERMVCADGMDLRECAAEYADQYLPCTRLRDGSFHYDEEEREWLIDSLAYDASWSPSIIAQHREIRDSQLERAFMRVGKVAA